MSTVCSFTLLSEAHTTETERIMSQQRGALVRHEKHPSTLLPNVHTSTIHTVLIEFVLRLEHVTEYMTQMADDCYST